MWVKMDCEEVNSIIPLFLEDKLSGDELSSFLSHIKNCDSCHEEIETKFLINEALSRLEEGESFDIHSEFLNKMAAYDRIDGLHNAMTLTRRIVLLIAGFLTAICLISMFI